MRAAWVTIVVLGACEGLAWAAPAEPAPKPPNAEERDLSPAQEIWFPPATSALPDDAPEPVEDEAASLPTSIDETNQDDPAHAIAPSTRTHDKDAADPKRRGPSQAGGFELQVAVGPTSAPLGHAQFSGGGRLLGMPTNQPFRARGEALGLTAPTFWGGELALRYERRYLALGVLGAIGHGGTVDGPVLDATSAQRIDTTHMSLYSGAVDVAGVVPIEPVTIRLGPVAGVRYVTAPLPGYEPTTCRSSSKRGSYTYSCPETASATTVFLQPRASFDVALSRGELVPALGGYVGLDVYPETAWSGGVTLTMRMPHWDLAP